MNNKMKTGVLVILLIVAALLMAVLYYRFAPRGQSGIKLVVVEVSAPGYEKSHTVRTEEEFLGAALQKLALSEGETGQFGLFVTSVDGIEANVDEQQWWCLTKAGEEVFSGVDMTPANDGDHFEFTLKTGW